MFDPGLDTKVYIYIVYFQHQRTPQCNLVTKGQVPHKMTSGAATGGSPQPGK